MIKLKNIHANKIVLADACPGRKLYNQRVLVRFLGLRPPPNQFGLMARQN